MGPLALVILVCVAAAGAALALEAQGALRRRDRRFPGALVLALLLLLAGLFALANWQAARGVSAVAGLATLACGGFVIRATTRAPTRPASATGQHRLVIALLLPLAGLCLATAGAIGAANRDDKARGAPAPLTGTAVNAITGELEERPAVRAPTHSANIDGGDIFRACDLSTESPCRFQSPPQALKVHDGDLLQFKTLLHNGGWRPLPYAKFFATAFSPDGPPGQRSGRIEVGLEVVWPRSDALDEAERLDVTRVVLKTPKRFPHLRYVPGSTALLGLHDRPVARLPDGIMSPTGLALANIGAPGDCFECDMQYVRFVSFRARVGSVDPEGRGRAST